MLALILRLLLFSITTSASILQTKGSREAIVDLGYVKYRGTRSSVTGQVCTVNDFIHHANLNSITTWYGIRYAAPPIFNRRWRHPHPIEQFGDYNPFMVIDATETGPICVQGAPAWLGTFNTSLAGQEDCLTVDVLVPNEPAAKRLPVWIQIHGGGYTQGSASTMEGYAMVNQSNGGLVFVQIQYRLGAFGFLDAEEFRQEDGVPNAGLLDQRLAMQWVRKYISAFGGDPDQVTISGGSAGGGSVTDHLIMYGGVEHPPFCAAVAGLLCPAIYESKRLIVSEYPWWQPYHSQSTTAGQYEDLLANTGCCDLCCLRSVSPNDLANAAQKTFVDGYKRGAYGFGDCYYGPVVDGIIIPGLPSDQLDAGKFTEVPLLTNRETYEGKSFTNASLKTTSAGEMDLKQLWPNGNEQFFTDLDRLYPATSYSSAFDRVSAILGESFIDCTTRHIAEAYASRGIQVWKMIFNAGTQVHAATLPFLFGESSDGQNERINNTIGDAMKEWFISFAFHGDPNGETLTNIKRPYWPAYKQENPTVLVVNDTSFSLALDPDKNARCDFFSASGAVILN